MKRKICWQSQSNECYNIYTYLIFSFTNFQLNIKMTFKNLIYKTCVPDVGRISVTVESVYQTMCTERSSLTLVCQWNRQDNVCLNVLLISWLPGIFGLKTLQEGVGFLSHIVFFPLSYMKSSYPTAIQLGWHVRQGLHWITSPDTPDQGRHGFTSPIGQTNTFFLINV